MKALSKVQIEYALKTTHSQWRLEGIFIRRDFEFRGFIDAWGFMNSVALLAEKADHHPNWENVYNRVVIRLSTHDAQGLTDKDLQLASAIDELANGTPIWALKVALRFGGRFLKVRPRRRQENPRGDARRGLLSCPGGPSRPWQAPGGPAWASGPATTSQPASEHLTLTLGGRRQWQSPLTNNKGKYIQHNIN